MTISSSGNGLIWFPLAYASVPLENRSSTHELDRLRSPGIEERRHLGHLGTQQVAEQFAANALGTPEPVLLEDPGDEIPNLAAESRAAESGA